jgi:mono/diheme cytochrome c family protein
MSHPIKSTTSRAALLDMGLVFSGTAALAQPAVYDAGKLEYMDNCASCHGVDGKGNGPLGNLLQRSPPDLTLLAKNNQGVLPMNRLYEVLDGANVPSHGTRDMPVWGREYRIEEAQRLREARRHYDEPAVVRARILTLLEYISRIQAR